MSPLCGERGRPNLTKKQREDFGVAPLGYCHGRRWYGFELLDVLKGHGDVFRYPVERLLS